MKSLKLFVFICALFAFTSCSHGDKKHGHKGHEGHGHHHEKHAGKGHKDHGHHHKGHKEHKGHKMWKKMDANSDGFLTKDEFNTAHKKAFTEMDKNSDGKVSKEEMKAHHKAMKGDKKSCCS